MSLAFGLSCVTVTGATHAALMTATTYKKLV